MSDWISWEEAVEVVALHFPLDRAEWLLHCAIRADGQVKVWAADEGGEYLAGSPGNQYFIAEPDRLPDENNRRLYRKVNFVDLPSLKLWVKALTSEPAPAPANDAPTKARRGGVEKADWETYGLAFADKVAKDGFPDENNVNRWQRQADVARWLAVLVGQDRGDVSFSTLARHAKKLMEQHRPHP